MNALVPILVVVVTILGIWMILRGWRAGWEQRSGPDFAHAEKRSRKISRGFVFVDSAIVVTALSFDLPVYTNPVVGKLLAGLGFVIGLLLVPGLTRPLLALLATVGVILKAAPGTALVLVVTYGLSILILYGARR